MFVYFGASLREQLPDELKNDYSRICTICVESSEFVLLQIEVFQTFLSPAPLLSHNLVSQSCFQEQLTLK